MNTDSFLENTLDTPNFHVLLLGNFNVPGFDWNSGLRSNNSHYYAKLKGEVIHFSICFLGLLLWIAIIQSVLCTMVIFGSIVHLSWLKSK
jgi:hypothetical protein